MKTVNIIMAMVLTVTSIAAGCMTSKPYRKCEGVVWGTTFHITYSSNAVLDDSIRAIMRDVDESLSAYNDSSLVSRINRCETNVTDSMFRRVFTESLRINKISGGRFDPTIAPLSRLWGFDAGEEISRQPEREKVDSIMRLVGIDACSLTEDGHVIKKSSQTTFNFSAIAKGYGCDLIGDMLSRNGVTDYMVEIGGEIVVRGKNSRGSDWRIMIDAPVYNADSVVHDGMAVIEIDSCAVATSGNYRNYKIIDGEVMGHTINPFTGQPAKSNILSVTVLAPQCITADAIATACMIMPLDSAKIMVERLYGVSAMFVTANDNGDWELVTTTGFPEITH